MKSRVGMTYFGVHVWLYCSEMVCTGEGPQGCLPAAVCHTGGSRQLPSAIHEEATVPCGGIARQHELSQSAVLWA